MRRSWKTNKGKWKSETGVWEGENLVPAKRQTPQERNTFSTAVVAERAILVSVCDAHTTMERTEECLRELAFLLETAGGVPVKSVIQKLDHPDSRTYIGSGKLEEVLEYKHATDADFLVFDDELTPAQLRNLERAFGCRILDRTTLILDIFAKRARSRGQNTGRAGPVAVHVAATDAHVDSLGKTARRHRYERTWREPDRDRPSVDW